MRAEAIITQLVFEHALRIRVKAETTDSAAGAKAIDSTPTTPDSASIAEHSPQSSGDEGTLHTSSTSDQSREASTATTLHASSASTTSSGSVAGKKGKKGGKDAQAAKDAEAAKEEESAKSGDGSNLVGRINNLVTTDLENIVDARDFLWIIVYIPVQIALCIVFLYQVLGWRLVFVLWSFLIADC